MGGEGEELSGGVWQRVWMRISLRRASWHGGGVTPAPGASLLAPAASVQPSAAGDEGWVAGTPWEQCQNRAVERLGPPAEAFPLPLLLEEPEKQRARPAIGVGHRLLVNDVKLAVFRARGGHRHTALLLCSPPTLQPGWLLLSPWWGLSVPGSVPLAASIPSLAWRRCGCKQPGCLQERDVATSEQGEENSNTEHETGRVRRMGPGGRTVRWAGRGGVCICRGSRGVAVAPPSVTHPISSTSSSEMQVPQCLLQHPAAHACCLMCC